jgi:hypothetical protein
LNLDVNDTERFGANVDLDETRIYRLVELSESVDKSDRAWKEKM